MGLRFSPEKSCQSDQANGHQQDRQKLGKAEGPEPLTALIGAQHLGGKPKPTVSSHPGKEHSSWREAPTQESQQYSRAEQCEDSLVELSGMDR